MPYINSFSIDGLAGRDDVTAIALNKDVNVFFGPNESGKTSLRRILDSALLHQADLLKAVPFKSAQFVLPNRRIKLRSQSAKTFPLLRHSASRSQAADRVS